MPFAIMWTDVPNSAELRLRLRDAHLDYMRANVHRVLASGGLLDDAGEIGDGGLIILATDSRTEVEAFVKQDPFYTGGLYRAPTVRRWRKAFFDGKPYL